MIHLLPKITTVLKNEIDKFTLDDMGGDYKVYSIKNPVKNYRRLQKQ